MKKIITKLNDNRGQVETVILVIIGIVAFIAIVGALRDRQTEIMAAWVGKHQSELIAEWGPPNNITTDGKGGTVLDYSYYKDKGQRIRINRRGRGRISPRGYTAKRYFYVDSNGIIYNFKWKRL